MRPIAGLASGLGVLVLLSAPTADASRPPTLKEREEITNWYPAYFRNAPVECVFIVIRISSRDRRYAYTGPQPLNALKPNSRCVRYASNGFYILKKRRGAWKQIYNGSVEPPCSLRIPRDLVRCR